MSERIELTDTPMSAMVKMVEGNPGAATVLAQLCTQNAEIDPDDAFQEMGPVFSLDTHGIYGPRIWMFYKDFCKHNALHVLAVLRAVQLGILSPAEMNHAIDNNGDGVDPEEVFQKVQKQLPKFGKQQTAA